MCLHAVEHQKRNFVRQSYFSWHHSSASSACLGKAYNTNAASIKNKRKKPAYLGQHGYRRTCSNVPSEARGWMDEPLQQLYHLSSTTLEISCSCPVPKGERTNICLTLADIFIIATHSRQKETRFSNVLCLLCVT